MAHGFEIGDRVVVKNHCEFPDGTVGTITYPAEFLLLASPGEWKGHCRTVLGRKAPIVFYFVQFDRMTDDGSGDGPYSGGEIDAESLFPYT
jgi:hypothetical protein